MILSIQRTLPLAVLTVVLATTVQADEKRLKTFILAGQSNMVGWGDSTKLPDDLRKGSDRVLMFENGEWQPLRPHEPVLENQKPYGLTEFHFGPEIAFGHELGKAFPDETIGVIKYAAGGSSILAWKPDWSKEDADRIGQGGRGSLYKSMINKVKQAQAKREIEIVGFVWQQGGRDMTKVDIAKEYLDNLKSLVAAVRKDTGANNLQFIYGSPRSAGYPDDLSDLVPQEMKGRVGAQWVVKAQWDAKKEIPNAKMVIVRDVETHPRNDHLSTAGQMVLGKLFAGAFLERASAGAKHTPTKMPMARPESVGMSTDGLSRIDELMKLHIDAGHIQGAVTVVARRGKVVHFSTHGQMDVKRGREMEPDAIFRMASSTKPVMGVAAMMMIEEGLIRPSDPVSKYIPEFANMKVAVLAEPADKDLSPVWVNPRKDVPKHRLVPVDTPVTIHHLLTHTSGILSGGLGSAVNPGVKRTGDDTLATYIPKLAKVPLDFQPRTRWSYSPRTGLDVVARIIEIVSETPFDEFLRERIFNPLEMNSSWFNLPSDKESKRVVIEGSKGWAKAKGWGKTGYFSASGGLSSAAEDYLHFEQMLLAGGEFFGHRLLRPSSVKTMSSNQVGDLYSGLAGRKKGQKGMGFGYTVAVTLDPDAAANNRAKGAFGWGGAFGTMSWTDPENELVAVIMLQQPHGRAKSDFGKAVRQAIIE
ncbi:MAG: hypothetical protein CMJ62_14275 [Planctomycetaceae bacterium]|nr:hypothetical protein [Planctomycetaceae bacterium]